MVDKKGKLEPYGPIYQNPYSAYLGLAEVAQALGVSALIAEMTGRFKAILYKAAGGKSEYFKPQIADLKIIYSMSLPKNHWARVGLETSVAISALDGTLINKEKVDEYLNDNKGIAKKIKEIQDGVKN